MQRGLKIGLCVLLVIGITTGIFLIIYNPFADNRNNAVDFNGKFPLDVNEYPDAPPGTDWILVGPGNIPITNPLKGFMPYYGEYDLFPYNLEYTYVPVNAVVGDSSTDFDYTFIEDILDDVTARGNQLVFRLFFDYPDYMTAVPQYLIEDGLQLTQYSEFGGGYSPDYDDPRMVNLMKNLIADLGDRYDGDPRVGFVQIGLLGHWGEWHTYPNSYLFANFTTQETVLDSFDDAFNETRILVRYPDSITEPFNVGFHDDSFAYHTLGPETYHFYPRMESSGTTDRWKNEPIGGEVRPEIQAEAFSGDLGESQNISQCINLTHASWMLETAVFTENWMNQEMNDELREQAAYVGTEFGYTFAVCYMNATYESVSDNLALKVLVHNFGVAPFYYNWSVEFGLVDDNFQVIQAENTTITIDGIMPDESVVWDYTWTSASGYADSLHMALRVPNQMNSGKPVNFANNNTNSDGWIRLGPLGNYI